MNMERMLRRGLIAIALAALAGGLVLWGIGRTDAASRVWAAGTIPVVAGLLVSMVRDFLAGRVGVDAIAFVSMTAALLLGENLAGIVVAVMYAGGNVLEDFAVARANAISNPWSIARPASRTGAARRASKTYRSTRSRSAMPFSCAPARSSRSTEPSPAPSPSSTRRH
jgi:cation transport ATPase